MKSCFIIFFSALVCVGTLSAQTAQQRISLYNINNSKVAIQGYDPVAYFTQNAALQGKPSISYTHRGIAYYFTSEANRALFEESPAKYEPQYGGWCAYAMGKDGTFYRVSPQSFKIINDRLYLFYNRKKYSALDKWNEDEAVLLQNANTEWSQKRP